MLVFNSSRTIPARLSGTVGNKLLPIEVRLAEHLPDNNWLALLLHDQASNFLRPDMNINFDANLSSTILQQDNRNQALWKLQFSKSGAELIDTLYKIGEPIRYNYVSSPWDLDYYQTVYAKEPGSSEMPSAGRAFTWEILFALKKSGIDAAFLTLHAGLSSYMDDRIDQLHIASEEEYFISKATADKINTTKINGGRIIAVGTTTVRALESAKQINGLIQSERGYTQLQITAQSRLKVADALLTGLHEPEASHLDLLTAFLKPFQIKQAYTEAIKQKYLWHEFGDLNLII